MQLLPFETSHVYVHPTNHPKHINNVNDRQADFGPLRKKNLYHVCTILCFDNTHNSATADLYQTKLFDINAVLYYFYVQHWQQR